MQRKQHPSPHPPRDTQNNRQTIRMRNVGPARRGTMKLESYPPVFRLQDTPTQNDDSGDTDKEIQEPEDPIPLIDLQTLNLDNQLAKACKGWGSFRLVNHGIPLTLLTQLQEHARSLFSLPFESKKELFTSPLSYFWGTPALTPSGDALSGGPRNINWVEAVNVPLGQLSQFHAKDHPTLDSFRVLLEEYGRHLAGLATTIFEAMANTLGLDPKQSKSYLSEPTGVIRVYRYPRCAIADEAWGMDVHTDSSVLSILTQDHVGGLEVLTDDKWHLVRPIPNSLVFNLGDMMQAMSDDEYKSVKHRVKVNKYEERFSICYFVFPAKDSVIRSTKYRPFTYSDFQAQVQQDIKSLGTKIGLERFKITDNVN